MRRGVVMCALLIAGVGIALIDGGMMHALAQGTPFGAPRNPAPPPETGGLVGWLFAKQAEFYKAMSAALRAAKSDGSAVTTLLGVAFLYGIFHAAGPGHGKAVISSYLIANEETARRGIVLSFASAFLQALVAVLIVAVAAWLFNATSQTMCKSERVIELASYALIAALGARLVWTKGRNFLSASQWYRSGAGGASDHDHRHDHHHGHHHHHDHAHQSHAAHKDGPPDTHCDHAHGPDLAAIAGPGGWRAGLSAVLAVGVRPCSGAILVLVFALAQGLFWAGIAATFVMGLGTAITVAAIALIAIGAKDTLRRLTHRRSGLGAVAIRFVEFAAAGLVLLLGIALLIGQAAAERVTCF
jgi:ABC-type nickel/cobalt efflux system permease component RcnA